MALADQVLRGHTPGLKSIGFSIEHIRPIREIRFKNTRYTAHVQIVMQRIS